MKKIKQDHIKTKILKIKFEKNISVKDRFKLFYKINDIKILKNEWNYIEIEIPNNKESLKEIFEILNKDCSYEDIIITEPTTEDIIKTFY